MGVTMSIGTLLGFLSGIGLFSLSVYLNLGNADWLLFLSLSSLIMVFGGTIANSYICYQATYVNQAIVELFKIFASAQTSKDSIISEINKCLAWADIAFKSGPVGLENHLNNEEPDEHLLGFGVDLVLREYTPEDVRALMSNTIESEYQRVSVQVDILENMSNNAPAFGMIGTLVGLIIMLTNLNNPEELGSAMALALLTTLYGVLFARLLFQPASKKVLQRGGIQRFRNQIIMEIFIMIREERPASFVRNRVRSFLRPSMLIEIENPRTAPKTNDQEEEEEE
jgi:chemotaxis protein MotA